MWRSLDRTKKVQLAGKKSFLVAKKVPLGFRRFRTYFWEVDHPLCDVWNNLIGAQVFGKGKIYKPTWTKIMALKSTPGGNLGPNKLMIQI